MASSNWYIVVERANLAYTERLAPYVYGPLSHQAACDDLISDSGITYCLLTEDAKQEGYIADEAYMTDDPPAGERIIPPSAATPK